METFIETPNLPKGPVSLMVVDGRITSCMEKELLDRGIRVIKTNPIKDVYEAISYHPDIMIHHVGGNIICVAPNIDDKVVYELENEGFVVLSGTTAVQGEYPKDVAYNVARVGEHIICKKDTVDKFLMEILIAKGLKPVYVKQGYSKCSTCVVSSRAIITSDKGIARSCSSENIDVLEIQPGAIELPGVNYGFIGGCTGYLSFNELAFTGRIENHPDYYKISEFLLKHGKKPINLCENTLLDLGTLLPLKEYSIEEA